MTVAHEQWIHMVGIGGAGMSGIARVLAEQGCKVSGSDLQESSITHALADVGVKIYLGHASSNLEEGVELLVISSAIPSDNPELLAAKERGIPVLKRGEMLARLVNGKKGIAIAGAHGKTTTTSMIYTILSQSQLDPTFIVGGELQGNGISAQLGQSEYAVVEADESDASFLELKPYVAVVTNIEDDHLDYYRSLDNIRKAFKKYIEGVQSDGFAIVYGEDESIRAICKGIGTPIITYGQDDECDYHIRDWKPEGIGSRFHIYHDQQLLGEIELSVPGIHNALNAVAAIATALEIGLDFTTVKNAIKTFNGAKRRFQKIGRKHSVLLVDDYAHHPTEIQATVAAAKCFHPEGRLVVVFQPHRYTRTQLLGPQLGYALKGSDQVVVTDVYPAGEKTIPGISGIIVHEAAKQAGVDSVYIPSIAEAESWLLDFIKENDLIITMGAGDIWKLGPSLLEKL